MKCTHTSIPGLSEPDFSIEILASYPYVLTVFSSWPSWFSSKNLISDPYFHKNPTILSLFWSGSFYWNFYSRSIAPIHLPCLSPSPPKSPPCSLDFLGSNTFSIWPSAWPHSLGKCCPVLVLWLCHFSWGEVLLGQFATPQPSCPQCLTFHPEFWSKTSSISSTSCFEKKIFSLFQIMQTISSCRA